MVRDVLGGLGSDGRRQAQVSAQVVNRPLLFAGEQQVDDRVPLRFIVPTCGAGVQRCTRLFEGAPLSFSLSGRL